MKTLKRGRIGRRVQKASLKALFSYTLEAGRGLGRPDYQL
jgi:hypothetical protein